MLGLRYFLKRFFIDGHYFFMLGGARRGLGRMRWQISSPSNKNKNTQYNLKSMDNPWIAMNDPWIKIGANGNDCAKKRRAHLLVGFCFLKTMTNNETRRDPQRRTQTKHAQKELSDTELRKTFKRHERILS